MSRLAGRTRMARKQLGMAASGLLLVALVPCRQVTGLAWPAWSVAQWRRVSGRDRELAQGQRRDGIRGSGRPAGPAAPGWRHRLRVTCMRAGGALDRQHVPPAAVTGLQPEGGVRSEERRGGKE